MVEQTWHEARLIPVSGINGAEEQERRATSALLAVMGAVREFGRALTQPLGAPAGHLETYIEVPFTLDDRNLRPDGLIRASRGSKSWAALVEVKTGNNLLTREQIEAYLDVAKDQGFDAVLTISNEIPALAGQHPTPVDKRKLRKVSLYHYSWSQVLAEAVMQKEHRGVADPDQAWILGELIRYLEYRGSGALQFNDMGAAWVETRNAVVAGTLRQTDPGLADVAAKWDALIRYISLQLGRRLGAEVIPALSRKELSDPSMRSSLVCKELCDSASMSAAIRVPKAIGDIVVRVDLRSRQVTCHVDVDAPQSGRPVTRVNWLARQLAGASDNLRIEAFVKNGRGSSSAELLGSLRTDPSLLVVDPAREFKTFRVAATSALGDKRGSGRGSFIDSVHDAVDAFYVDVMQGLKAWRAAPPAMRDTPAEEAAGTALSSTALSSQDEPTPGFEARPSGSSSTDPSEANPEMTWV